MKNKMDYQKWEVLESKGRHQSTIIASIVVASLLAALVVFALGALFEEGVFNRAFWFLLLLIVPGMMMLWGWGISSLLQAHYEGETQQRMETSL